MALYHPDDDNSEALAVVSVRSFMPVGDPSTFDDQLIIGADFADMKPNNHIFHPEMKTQNPGITEILKGHTFLSALSEVVPVPLIYVQQFWKHIQYVPAAGYHHFVSRIDHFTVTFGINKLRETVSISSC